MQKEKGARGNMGFYIVLTIIGLLAAAVLELNKNILPGWILLIIVLIAFGMAYPRIAQPGSTKRKVLAWLLFLLWIVISFLLSQLTYGR